ncbi:MAG: hypothetical protein NTU63_03740 [Candidatus Pacearchaeota archaeon]|nr:hypothetical protein [Candidatus Pacearchaeota archaeon]
MQEVYKLLISIGILALGFPIGSLLAKRTEEELFKGRKWFKLIIILSLIGGIVSLILRNDFLLFSLLFISIVTSRSMKK